MGRTGTTGLGRSGVKRDDPNAGGRCGDPESKARGTFGVEPDEHPDTRMTRCRGLGVRLCAKKKRLMHNCLQVTDFGVRRGKLACYNRTNRPLCLLSLLPLTTARKRRSIF